MYGLPLVIGTTYVINNNIGGIADFTNVGAPNNNAGTYFVATGTTPNNWGVVGDVDLGYNTGAPVVTVLENTIGDVYWVYYGLGVYTANLNGSFLVDKTISFITGNSAGDGWVFFTDYSFLPNALGLSQYDSTGSSVDNCICQIEIRVYE
jgi:hypothetical protein